MPLYEDNAPWIIVFNGPKLDYIDYDTRGKVYDKDVQKTYMVLAVLMNHKETLKFLDHCLIDEHDRAPIQAGYEWSRKHHGA